MNASEVLADPGYGTLRDWIIERTGLAYYSDKDSDLAARLARRLGELEMRGCEAYLRLLEDSRAGLREMNALVSELTIGETYFFRHREHFDALRDTIVPDLLRRNGAQRRLRFWSAGCATGAEAYSLALLLRLEMAEQLAGWDVSILATDINRLFLERARKGRFERWALREVSEELANRCFLRDGKQWVLLPEYRQGVTFQYHNLVSDPLPLGGLPAFDLIFCRNVMIYFNRETIRSTVERFYHALGEGGWLVVGHAEPNAEMFRAFHTICQGGVTLYQKCGAGYQPAAASQAAAPPLAMPPRARIARRPSPAQPAGRATPAPEGGAAVSVAQAWQLADRGEWAAAAALCGKLLSGDPLNAAAHFLLGMIREHDGAHEEAEGSLRRAIYLERSFALAHYHLALLRQKDGAVGEARRALENVVELLARRPDDEPVEGGDGITAAELAQSARLHLDLLEEE